MLDQTDATKVEPVPDAAGRRGMPSPVISPMTRPVMDSVAGPIVSLTSLGFILLQSACTAVMTLSGLRLLIGIGSLTAAASSTVRFLDTVHGAAFRIPMTVLAILGAIVNLYVVWRIRSLRSRPSSAWRVRPATSRQVRSERLQILFAIVTLILVVVELIGHENQFGNLFS